MKKNHFYGKLSKIIFGGRINLTPKGKNNFWNLFFFNTDKLLKSRVQRSFWRGREKEVGSTERRKTRKATDFKCGKCANWKLKQKKKWRHVKINCNNSFKWIAIFLYTYKTNLFELKNSLPLTTFL